MKPILLPFLLVLTTTASFGAAADWRPLFDGTLNGWSHWLGRPHPNSNITGLTRDPSGRYAEPLGWGHDPLRVFTIVELDGRKALRLSGEVFGYLATQEECSNFHLRLQFKWGEKRWPPRDKAVRDSGLLYFVTGEPGVSYEFWPSCLELQIQTGDCGDMFALKARTSVTARPAPPVNGYPRFNYDPAASVVLLEQEGPNGNHCVKSADHERPMGEWNTVELVCLGWDSIHIVNGHVVMRLAGAQKQGTNLPLTSGHVALQTEGAEVYYRDIEIRPITEIPPEFRAP